MAIAFELKDLEVSYGSHIAVSGLSLKMDEGESLAILGQNGAGKTSTIRALLGMIKPRKGSSEVFGLPAGDTGAFAKMGYAPEEGSPPEFLNGREYLTFIGGFRGVRQKDSVEEALQWFELDPRKRVSAYSKGMKRRLLLAQAMIGNPKLLILDEPLNGLDPVFIVKLRERVEQYIAGGGSLLFSSHILTEVEKICRNVAILKLGKMVKQCSTQQLVEEFGSVEAAFVQEVKG